MKSRLLSTLVLIATLSISVAAQDWVAQGDKLARWGALREADAAYLKAQSGASQQQLRTVLVRRLTLAEALGDLAGVEQLLARLAQLPQDEELQLRTTLARATLASSRGRLKEAQPLFEEVAQLAAGNKEPYAVFANFAAYSFLYRQKLASQGWPSQEQFNSDVGTAFGPLLGLPTKGLYEPLALTRAHPWVEFWILKMLERIQQDPVARRKDLDNLGAFVGIMQLALADRFLKQKDPEAGGLAAQYPLDMAEGLLEFNPKEAQNWLNNVAFLLQIGRKSARQANLGSGVDSAGLAYFEARHLQLRARLRLIQKKPGPAFQDYAAALDQLRLAELPLPLIELLLEYSQALDEHRPQGWQQLALKASREAGELGRRWLYPPGTIGALVIEGRVLESQGQPVEALRRYRQAVEQLEDEAPRLGLTSEQQAQAARIYDPLIRLLVDQNQAVEALQFSQRREHLGQLAGLDLEQVRLEDAQSQAALKKVVRSRERAQSLSQQLEVAQTRSRPGEVEEVEKEVAGNRAEFLQALNDIEKTHPEYGGLVAIRPTVFAKIQPLLPPEALLIQYCQLEKELLIFTASSQRLSVKTVAVDRATLTREIRSMRRAVLHRSDNLQPLGSLYTRLLAPVQAELEQAKLLLVAPSEQIYYVPFAALRGPSGYLIESKSLALLTDVELLTTFADKQAFEPGLLAFGDPDGSLPAARKEVNALGGLFPGADVLVAAQVQESRLKSLSPKTTLVHLATHGYIDPADVNASYLLMGGQGGASRLTLGEIYGLDLGRVSLVTLSACETALGQGRPTWAVASLAQAFSLAGARTLVASLWKVSDQGTYELMLEFYRGLAAGKSKSEALRAAQRALLGREEYAHPFYWSAFALIGDWR